MIRRASHVSEGKDGIMVKLCGYLSLWKIKIAFFFLTILKNTFQMGEHSNVKILPTVGF